MELRKLWNVLMRWAWLIVLATVLAAGASYLVSRATTPVYSASTTILVNQAQNPAAPDYNSVLTSERLTQTYSQLLRTRPILTKAIQDLKLSLTPEQLDQLLSVRVVTNTALIELTAESTTPALARDIANTVANDFIADTQAVTIGENNTSHKALAQQLADLESQMQATNNRLTDVRTASGAQSADALQLQSVLSQEQVTYSQLLKTQDDMRLAESRVLDSLRVVEPAVLPDAPVRPKVALNVLIAAVVGVLIGVGVVFLIEYLDDTVKSAEEAEVAAGLTSLGLISRLPRTSNGASRLVDELASHTPIAEAYRVLRTNVDFARVSQPGKTLLVTSSNQSEGKTTTLANLAIVMAESGRRVLAVDSDLRRPMLHRVFGLPNARGLTNLLLDADPDPTSAIQPTRIAQLAVITSGPIPPNPSELLGSDRMERLLGRLTEHADIVVLDSPPVLAVTDPTILASRVDGVVIVVDAGRTRLQALVRAKETLTRGSAHILGTVLNRMTNRAGGYYYYYYRQHGGDDGFSDVTASSSSANSATTKVGSNGHHHEHASQPTWVRSLRHVVTRR